MTETDISKADKGDILGIIDYLLNGVDIYNTAGREYDDDELIEINRWAMRCVAWLKEQAEVMP